MLRPRPPGDMSTKACAAASQPSIDSRRMFRCCDIYSGFRHEQASLRAGMKNVFIGALIAGAGCIASATIQGQKPRGFTCDPGNGGLALPAGFCSGVIAANFGTARNLVVA